MAGCWYVRISSWFDRHGFSVDRLPPFRYSLDSPFVRLTRQEINRIIWLDLARISTQATWQGTHELPTRLLFYREQFMHWSEDGELIRPRYLESHMSHALRIAIGQLRVSSHQLRIESGRAEGIPREHRICRLCTTGEVETEEHYICRCPLYYEIRGRYHCLFAKGFGPLVRVMNFPDQRCLGLFLIKLRRLRDHTLRRVQIVRGHPPSPERDRSQRHITDYTSRDGETEGEQDHPYMTRVDHDDRGRRRSRQMEDSPQRQVRPRTMVVHPITDTLGDTSHVHGVTIDMAQRILQRRRPLVPRRHCTQRQLLIRDMLIRHRQSTPPSTSDVISTFSFLTEAGEDEETQPPIPTTP